ncbi:hypothetical protein pEaSNUABM37_00022 [Erwinia phage pEa_SNUABM_37]|nr:hypothetical protein pEaSNUABM37_00022 [Erwinia phage pEa_SNUABM_37]QXO10492.1 hypothetical protein pEaSNUABM48_00022 [Erwinia phage pEa_SNUABM_48]
MEQNASPQPQGRQQSLQNISVLHLHSTGVVAAAKSTNSREIQVNLREMSSYMSGQVTVDPQQLEYKGTTAAGEKVQDKLVTDQNVTAIWLPHGSNRVTAPDVQPGERVEVWRVGDEDKYYWCEMGLDDELRRLETIVIAISGSPATTENKDIGDGDWYFIEWSSHKKHMMMSNSKANGEVVQYVAKFDYGEGKFSVADDLDNAITLDSVKALWMMINTDKSMFKIDKKNVEIIAQDTFKLTAKQKIHMICQDWLVQANNSITFETQTWKVNTQTTEINSPGGIKLVGPITHSGGDTTTSGSITAQKDVRGGGISLMSHRHGGVQSGGSTTAGPQ